MTSTYTPAVKSFADHYTEEPLVIENQTFYAMTPGQTAIDLSWPAAESIAQCGAIIRNCCFKPGLAEWATAIKLTNGWHCVIENCNIVSGPTGNLQCGVTLDGQSMNTRIHNLTVTHPWTGILVTGESEGTKISGCEILASYIGIVFNTPQGEAGAWVTDTHISAARAGIIAVNRPQAFYQNLLIYRHHWRAGEAFDGMLVYDGSHHTSIENVQVNGLGATVNPVYASPGLRDVRQRDVREITA